MLYKIVSAKCTLYESCFEQHGKVLVLSDNIGSVYRSSDTLCLRLAKRIFSHHRAKWKMFFALYIDICSSLYLKEHVVFLVSNSITRQ